MALGEEQLSVAVFGLIRGRYQKSVGLVTSDYRSRSFVTFLLTKQQQCSSYSTVVFSKTKNHSVIPRRTCNDGQSMEEHSKRRIKWKKNDPKQNVKPYFQTDDSDPGVLDSSDRPCCDADLLSLATRYKRARTRICQAIEIRLAFVSQSSISLPSPSPLPTFYC